MASAEDQEHKRKLLKLNKSRLRQRELQLATFGVSVDPSVVTEIDALKESIATLEAHQPQSPLVIEAQKVVRNQYEGDVEFLIADGNARNRRQTRLEEKQSDLAVTIGHIENKLLVVVDDIVANKIVGIFVDDVFQKSIITTDDATNTYVYIVDNETNDM